MGILGPMWAAGRHLGTVAAAASLLLATGCGSAQPGASSVATRFVEALDSDDAGAACGFLAPATKSELEKSAGKPCPAALTEEDLPAAGPVEKTEAFGTMAQVRFAEDTMFLAEFQGGWKVMAAGCSPEPGHPYDCRLQGG